MTNPNTVFANTFVDALVAGGLRRICITPGSRHTPLVLAFARHADAIQLYSLLDERSAAFFALGMALSTGEAAAFVCTSGSAVANAFPAVVEARQSRLPLLILSADRPPELSHSGANQTIDQVKLFGDYAAFFVDAPLPEADAPAVVIRNLRALAARALHMSERGVVHVNLPFRKPFEPGDSDSMAIDARPPTRMSRPSSLLSSSVEAMLGDDILQRKGLIYFSHGSCRTAAEAESLRRWAAGLSRISGFPILAEGTSNMRFAAGVYQPLLAYETFAEAAGAELRTAESLIRVGAPPLCKAMIDIIAEADLRYHISLVRGGDWADDSHSTTHHIHIDPLALGDMALPDRQPTAENLAFRDRLARADAISRALISREVADGAYFDGAAVYDAVDLLPENGIIFAGNSLPVRHLDQFGDPGEKRILALANRGASGIDGNISTALGAAAAHPDRPVAAIVGDITFYHDMNGLLAIQRCGIPMTIVLLNNGGGGIFQRLPIRAFEPQFSDFFITDHGLDFAHAAALYGLDYARIDDRDAFRAAFSESINARSSTIIEVRTDALHDLRRRAEIMRAASLALASELA